MKKLLLLGLVLLSARDTHAQFGLGGQLNYITFPSAKVSNFGLGANCSFLVGDDKPLRITANYSLPKTEDFTTYAYAFSSATDPQSVEVKAESKFSMINVWADYQYFFGRGDWEDGGFYGYLGIGLAVGISKIEPQGYNTTLYDANIESQETFTQWILRGGFGYDVQMDFGNLFFEAGLNLPANKVGESYVAIQMPLAIVGNVGLRYWLGA
jgi:hypothetical protein